MRTTLNIDDDILAAAKELARRKRTTTGKFVSDVMREILFVPNEPERLVHIQTFQRRDAIVQFGPVRAGRVEETHGRTAFVTLPAIIT